MADQFGAEQLIGHRLVDRDGVGIGRIGQVYFDDQTDTPTWVTVRIGLFGTKEAFVPLQGAKLREDSLHVPFDKEQVRRAPSFHSDQHISVAQEDEVYLHYGLDIPGQWVPSRGRHAAPQAAAQAPAQRPGEAPERPVPATAARHKRVSWEFDEAGAAGPQIGGVGAEQDPPGRSTVSP
ncbi:PRC-barrel domain protein [Murinocardiopsis flavida]|uniref:PRC-barrel domain protein n=1 Tax=Murinocardiopsis flavida TaxID=645275 RepID=A0A2P8D6J0_9ACTN|nr:PRC-barrel domain-containing protein [Murinocardiopsis flavida]PSK92834.1 PRC-barrel domain protein [Murinocardiopsis flavida]